VDYIELSGKDVERDSLILANMAAESWGRPDAVVFVARGAFKIGHTMAQHFQVPLLEIQASRKSGKIKTLISPFLFLIPAGIKKKLRSAEVGSDYHKRNADRDVRFNRAAWDELPNINRILLTDDSVDTGNTVLAAKKALQEFFPGAEIKIAALNYFSFSQIRPDFFLRTDTMLNGPWSRDSEENKQFAKEYLHAKKEGTLWI